MFSPFLFTMGSKNRTFCTPYYTSKIIRKQGAGLKMIKYDRLWATMKEKGITKYELNKKYNISKSLLHRLQHNQGISMNTVDILCSILDCQIEDIAEFVKD